MAGPLEKDIQASICDYLALKRIFFSRINTTPVFDTKQKTFRAMPKYSRKGMSDILAVHAGKPYFLEVKRPNTKPSEDQKRFGADAEQAGAIYAVVRSIDDVVALGL